MRTLRFIVWNECGTIQLSRTAKTHSGAPTGENHSHQRECYAMTAAVDTEGMSLFPDIVYPSRLQCALPQKETDRIVPPLLHKTNKE